MRPVWNSTRSVSVVLPASTWALARNVLSGSCDPPNPEQVNGRIHEPPTETDRHWYRPDTRDREDKAPPGPRDGPETRTDTRRNSAWSLERLTNYGSRTNLSTST